MPGGHPRSSPKTVLPLNIEKILGGTAAAAVAGTLAYSVWKGPIGLFLVQLHVLFPYLALPYPILYLLAPTEETGVVAFIDRVCATLTAVGLLVPWGWYVTVPLTPQNAQAPVGLFMMGWIGAAGFYGTVKLCIYALRMGGDDSEKRSDR